MEEILFISLKELNLRDTKKRTKNQLSIKINNMTLNEKMKDFCDNTSEIDTAFILVSDEEGNISLNFIGMGRDEEESLADVGTVLSMTMVQNEELTAMIMSAIPTTAEMFADEGNNEKVKTILEGVNYLKEQIETSIQKRSN